MPNERALNLDKYNISKHRYYELKSKVQQYDDWKAILRSNAKNNKRYFIVLMILIFINKSKRMKWLEVRCIKIDS